MTREISMLSKPRPGRNDAKGSANSVGHRRRIPGGSSTPFSTVPTRPPAPEPGSNANAGSRPRLRSPRSFAPGHSGASAWTRTREVLRRALGTRESRSRLRPGSGSRGSRNRIFSPTSSPMIRFSIASVALSLPMQSSVPARLLFARVRTSCQAGGNGDVPQPPTVVPSVPGRSHYQDPLSPDR